jgi:hypothetical protein
MCIIERFDAAMRRKFLKICWRDAPTFVNIGSATPGLPPEADATPLNGHAEKFLPG